VALAGSSSSDFGRVEVDLLALCLLVTVGCRDGKYDLRKMARLAVLITNTAI